MAAHVQAFGLANSGATCYLNSLLQGLASCPALVRALAAPAPAGASATRAALGAFFARAAQAPPQAPESAPVLAALVADLARRRPATRFGAGQESASEALVLLLEMAADPELDRLLTCRWRCTAVCGGAACGTGGGAGASDQKDEAPLLELFHLDGQPPATPADFARALRLQISALDASAAPAACAACRAPARARVYRLTLAPEVLVGVLNLYEGYAGGARRQRYLPARFALPAAAGGDLAYRLVATVEHAGTLAGGHYWARGLRATPDGGQAPYLLNDLNVMPAPLEPSPNTYLAFWHRVAEPAPAEAAPSLAP